ncbi:hypothetical protein CDUR_12110 [Corynebacterium durum]|nr:hypothetical protein [Corynebacterium durum]WJY86130.1 hypothetical protein CDUR_12110 [Corynebacterium durum]
MRSNFIDNQDYAYICKISTPRDSGNTITYGKIGDKLVFL